MESLNIFQASIAFSAVNEVSYNAFRDVPELRSIYLLYNNITKIPPGTFDYLPKLE